MQSVDDAHAAVVNLQHKPQDQKCSERPTRVASLKTSTVIADETTNTQLKHGKRASSNLCDFAALAKDVMLLPQTIKKMERPGSLPYRAHPLRTKGGLKGDLKGGLKGGGLRGGFEGGA